ncbi:DUF2946 domain-containing protein [Oxalobacteraceae bacterium OM1]|nr:DUF2946 domain-containing protein [Oxalobacteraceae bacterium OM1]
MSPVRFRRSFAVWIACLAILVAALMPTVAAAMQAQSSFLGDICTAAGLKVGAAPDSTPDGAGSKAANHLKHCPYCFTHAGSFGLPPGGGIALPVAAGMVEHPSLFYRAPHPLFAWISAQPRAPPVLA